MNQNPTDHHTQIEQAAFEPNNLVPGIGVSPDKMLLGRVFSYADAHRARLGTQPNTLINKVLDDEARSRLVSNVVGHLRKGVTPPVLKRAIQYWRNIDKPTGDRIAEGVRDKLEH